MFDAGRLAGVRGSSSDEKFVAELKLGSHSAWSLLYEQYADKLYRLAWLELWSRQDAEDVVATAFVRALQVIERYQHRGSAISAWLYQVARNVIRERRRELARHQRRHESIDPGNAGPLDLVGVSGEQARDPGGVALRMDLLEGLRKLTKEQQTVLGLTHFAGFSVRETAQILGKGERAVYYTQARALIRLKSLLD